MLKHVTTLILSLAFWQENRLVQHTMQALQSELDNLRADNIKLYEKIKFLQSYPGRVSVPPYLGPKEVGGSLGGLIAGKRGEETTLEPAIKLNTT